MSEKILIVDDEAINRELLCQIFSDQYEVIQAEEGKEAIRAIQQHQKDLVVILLDLIMPKVNGYQVLQVLNASNLIKNIPVILITANTDMKIALACYSLGAADIINKPFVAQIVKHRITNTIEQYKDKKKLKELLMQSNQKLSKQEQQLTHFYDNLIDTVSNLLEFRNVNTSKHVSRVRSMTGIMAQTYRKLYPEDGLSKQQMETIVRTSTLHDIGKISIPDSILMKPGRLTDREWEVMKSHTTRGCEILSTLENFRESDQYTTAYDIVRHHHERYDGRGYPDSLKGDDIPLSAQLVSVVDVYDALVTERVYKKAYSKEKAYDMIMKGECGAFSEKMMLCLEHARKVIELYSDTHQ